MHVHRFCPLNTPLSDTLVNGREAIPVNFSKMWHGKNIYKKRFGFTS